MLSLTFFSWTEIRSHQIFVRPLLLPAASLARLAAGSSNGLTNNWRYMCSFELLMMDGKTRPKHVERLTKINRLRNVAFVGCTLRIAFCWILLIDTELRAAMRKAGFPPLIRTLMFLSAHWRRIILNLATVMHTRNNNTPERRSDLEQDWI